MQRRQLLMLPAFLPVLLPLSRAAAAPGGDALAFLGIHDDAAAPLFERGGYLIAEVSQTAFRGAGVYLYPDWGRPRAYAVREIAPGRLGFFTPGRPALLWSMPAAASRFAGRVRGSLGADDEPAIASLHALYSELIVPELPPA